MPVTLNNRTQRGPDYLMINRSILGAMKLDAKTRAFFEKTGRKGGLARAKALTPERRREIAKLASLARHAKRKSPPAKNTA